MPYLPRYGNEQVKKSDYTLKNSRVGQMTNVGKDKAISLARALRIKWNLVCKSLAFPFRYLLGRIRLQNWGLPDAQAVNVPKVSGFLDSTLLGPLSILTNDMEYFHPDLQEILRIHEGIRKWEYGMMVHGLPSLEGKDVLDIGPGPSFLPVYLAERLKARVTVLDLPEPYTIELEALTHRLHRHGVVMKVGDMRRIPFPEGSFDVVISISAIEHLNHSADHKTFLSREDFVEDTKRTLREMYRVLRPGGWMYITSDAYLPGRVDHDNWAGKLLDGDPYAAYPLDQVSDIFVSTLRDLGASFPYPIYLNSSLLLQDSKYASYRSRYMTVFNLFAQKPAEA